MSTNTASTEVPALPARAAQRIGDPYRLIAVHLLTTVQDRPGPLFVWLDHNGRLWAGPELPACVDSFTLVDHGLSGSVLSSERCGLLARRIESAMRRAPQVMHMPSFVMRDDEFGGPAFTGGQAGFGGCHGRP